MKKRFTACLTTLILSVFFSISASADVVEVDGIYYDISGTSAKVTKGDNKYSGDIVIPESITYENSKYSVTSIGDWAFCGCRSLTSVTIPNSVTSIGDEAFVHCRGLTSVTIPNSVTSIGESAFEGCSGLTSVTIPNSVTNFGYGAFNGCTGITQTIIVNDMFVFLPTGYEGHYSIPENISTIIGGAFYDCSGLTSVTIPNSVTSIAEGTFSGCSSLTSVNIPNSVTSIAEGAFPGCRSLTSITIPNSVTSIGDYAFSFCLNIENVYCYAEVVPSTDGYAFYNSDIEKATLHVPASAIEAYKTTAPWSGFGTIKAIEETVGVESVKDRGIAIQSAGGFINISGLDNNEKVSFYGIDGKALGSATAINGTTSFAAQSGSIVVAKIGKENIKIAVK